MFRPVLGGSHIHCENWPVPVFASCYENPIGSYIYIYIYIYLLVRTNQVIKILKFFTFTQFSNRAILAYIIILNFQIQFSQPDSHTFKKLNLNLIINFIKKLKYFLELNHYWKYIETCKINLLKNLQL
jgi:hypothetical protein